jgi:hypothetical protein
MNEIEKLLVAHAEAPIADEGFTARMMGALPPRAARERAWLRPVLVLGSAALGSVLALVLAPGDPSLVEGFADLVSLRGLTPAALTGIGMSVALLVSGLVHAAEGD